jgi:hypothetical protein
MMRILIYVFLGIFSMNTLQVSAQVRIGGLEKPHSSAVLDLNKTDASEDGNWGLALPRVKLSSDKDLLNRRTPPNGMMVYNTGTSLDQGVYYYSDNKWIKLPDGSFFSGDAIVGNEVADATPGGGLIRSGRGTADSTYTLGIDKEGVKNDRIAGGAVTGDKIASALDKSVLQNDGTGWAPAMAENILKAATAAGVKIASVKFKRSSYYNSNGKCPFDSDPKKTLFLVNGYYFDDTKGSRGYAPMYISAMDTINKIVLFPKTAPSKTDSFTNPAAQWSLVIVEFE